MESMHVCLSTVDDQNCSDENGKNYSLQSNETIVSSKIYSTTPIPIFVIIMKTDPRYICQSMGCTQLGYGVVWRRRHETLTMSAPSAVDENRRKPYQAPHFLDLMAYRNAGRMVTLNWVQNVNGNGGHGIDGHCTGTHTC